MAPRKKIEDGEEPAKPSVGNVFVRITKFGAGRVSTGEHVAEVGDIMADMDDVLEVSEDVGKSLEGKGYGEIQ